MTQITENDEGKPIVHGNETVGRIVNVEHGTAFVDPDPGITDAVMSKLGLAEEDEGTYPLQEETILEITDNEVRLRE